MSECFAKPNSIGANAKVELVLSNYTTKTDLKMQQVLIHHLLLKKTDSDNLKSDVDKLDTDKLKYVLSGLSSLKSKVDKSISVPVDLSKLSDAVKNDLVKKDAYNAKIKKMLKIKYLILLTYLLKLLVMLK